VVKVPTNEDVKRQTLNFIKILDRFPEFKFIGDPILRKKTIPVSVKEGLEIADKLWKTLNSYRKITGYGRGLAAPQIGIGKSVFITYLDDHIQYYINPKIITKSVHSNYCRELCLSCGLVWPDVKRPETVVLQWKDNDGNIREQEFSSLPARLIQHEYDHLLGIPNIDRAERGTIEICSTNPLDEKLRNNL
jgi:peptide deformylase